MRKGGRRLRPRSPTSRLADSHGGLTGREAPRTAPFPAACLVRRRLLTGESLDVTSPRSRHDPALELARRSPDTASTPEPAAGDAVPAPERSREWSALMARAQAGDGEAYRRLLNGITPYLRARAARQHREPSDVEDAVQDILLTVHAVRHTYDPARPFGPWLAAIAKHRLVDRLRRQGRLRAREAPLAPEHETYPAEQTNLSDDTLEGHALAAAIDRLPPAQREAIRLVKLKEMSLKEAAATSGMSVAALKVATHRALKNLRKMLSGRSEHR